MKKYIVLILLITSKMVSAQQLTISWPISGCVFQRDNAGNATVYIIGQANSNSAYYIDYKIAQLDKLGVQTSIGSWNSSTTVSSINARIFRIPISLSTGWYRIDIQVRSSTGLILNSSNVKFGIGEVFIIAGQSNAQGYGSDYGVPNLENLDCVRSFKNIQAISTDGGGAGFGYVTDFVNLERPVIGPLNDTDRNIAPNSTRTWFYQSLGNQIAINATANKVTPVMFFNVALVATSINNWKRGLLRTREMFANNYSNILNSTASTSIDNSLYPINHPWGSNASTEGLFTNLKNVISLYGNSFGVRAVLWHQGEAETKTLLNINYSYNNFGSIPSGYSMTNYQSILKEIIDETRIILPNLKWAISKVSLTSEYKSNNILDKNIINNSLNPAQLNKSWIWSNPYQGTGLGLTPGIEIKNSSNLTDATANVIKQQELLVANNLSYVSWFTQTSDSYASGVVNNTYGDCRTVDGTHFNQAGLTLLANNAYSNIVSSGAFSMTPVLATPPPILNLSKSGTIFTATLSHPTGGTYSKYQWETHYSFSYDKYNQSIANTR